MSETHKESSSEPGSAQFATTHWSVVLAAKECDSRSVQEALEKLCRTYWYPLYAYVRQRGREPHEAQDLTQEFFLRLLDKHYLAQVDRRKGKFRSFLMVAVNHFLANEWDRAKAAKRGGRVAFIPFEEASAEERYALELVTDASPEKIFERRWALAVLEQALERLRREVEAAGKSQLFAALHPFISREAAAGEYADVGKGLGIAAGAVAVAFHRLRTRYREMVRQEISNTLMNAAEVDQEMRHLFAVLRG